MKSEIIYRLLWQPLGSIKLYKYIISKKSNERKQKKKIVIQKSREGKKKVISNFKLKFLHLYGRLSDTNRR